MDAQLPAVYNLPPELAHHVLRHLGKRDKQHFALCCKHTYLCALAAVKALVLSHKCLTQGKSWKFKTVRTFSCTFLIVWWQLSKPLHVLLMGTLLCWQPAQHAQGIVCGDQAHCSWGRAVKRQCTADVGCTVERTTC